MRVIDSHTGGEPTRLIVEGLSADLTCPTGGSVAERAARCAAEIARLSGTLCAEPRGSAVMVGAALVEPANPACALGLIFFNNVGALGMCGHGTMGALASLAWLGVCKPGPVCIETPVGVVRATLHPDGRRVSVENVPSFRWRAQFPLQVPRLNRQIHGDIAWGGNWFFLVYDHGLALDPKQIPALHAAASAIRAALDESGIQGDLSLSAGRIDHVELLGPPSHPDLADSRNFVLCPGGEYDRSPCGTGTSAKLACLAADGLLAPGQRWRQQSIVGSVFEACYQPTKDGILPEITGTAFVTADTRVLFDPLDPFVHGLYGA